MDKSPAELNFEYLLQIKRLETALQHQRESHEFEKQGLIAQIGELQRERERLQHQHEFELSEKQGMIAQIGELQRERKKHELELKHERESHQVELGLQRERHEFEKKGLIAQIDEIQKLQQQQPEKVPRQSFTNLLRAGKIHTPNKHVLERVLSRFSSRVMVAVSEGNSEVAVALYQEVKALPQTATRDDLQLHGLFVNGPLPADERLSICFDEKGSPSVLKPLEKPEERERLNGFYTAVIRNFDMPAGLLPFTIQSSHGKFFLISPLLGTTLEHVPRLGASGVKRLWDRLSPAIDFLHSHGFAHMDIKPSNVLLDHEGNPVLGDLGSVERFGQNTATTPYYVPLDLRNSFNQKSAPKIDWAMFAMAVAEKVGFNVADFTSARLFEILQEAIPSDVFEALKRKFDEV